MALPDFLLIGAQKAGTTWLHANLLHHPDVWLPPLKEIHYFDRRRAPLILDAMRGRMRREMLWRWLEPALADARAHPANRAWHARFFLQSRSDRWYARCFDPQPGQIAGDNTPAYARLNDTQVARVARLLPDARILYILRDPVERTWSQAAMYFSRYGHRGLAHASEAEIARFLDWNIVGLNNDYAAVLARWERHYGPGQFTVAFFDDLAQDPAAFLSRICGALGIAPIAPVMPGRVHGRDYPPAPPHIRAELARRYRPMIEQVHARFGNRWTQAWLDRAGS